MTFYEEIEDILSNFGIKISSAKLKDKTAMNTIIPVHGVLNPIVPGKNEIEKEIIIIIKDFDPGKLEELSDQIIVSIYEQTDRDINFPEYQIIQGDSDFQSEIVITYRKEI